MRSGYHDPSLNAYCGLNPSIDSKITASNALIVAVDGGNPAIFYYAKRKGWHSLEKEGIYDRNPGDSQQAHWRS